MTEPLIISIDAEKSSDKTLFPFIIKNFSKIEIAVNFFYLIKRIHQNSIANSLLNDEQIIPFEVRNKSRNLAHHCAGYISWLYSEQRKSQRD